ncbi:MAG: hypothetical protein ABJI96_05960 [Paracoccaceae bacterium]
MSEDSSFPVRPTQLDQTIDDLESDNQFDPEIVAVRNLVKEECALPTWRKMPGHVDAPALQKKQRVVLQVDIASNWFRWTIQTLVRSAATFFRRPDAPRILAMLILFVVVVIMPWFILSLVLSGILLTLIIYFSLGPDRVCEMVAAWHTRLRCRDLDRAEDIRRRAAFWSKHISAIVSRLPEKWTAGLYLPDFEETSERPEKMKTDPFDRLATQKTAQ